MAGKTQNRKKSGADYMEQDFSCGTIRIYEGKKNDYGTISLDCGFAIRVQIIHTKKRTFISYPSYRDKDNNYTDLAYCFDSDVIEELNDVIKDMYK